MGLWGSSELLARATRGRALIENETDGEGRPRTLLDGGADGRKPFSSLDETCVVRLSQESA
jgi:hypothetical protein